MVVVAVVVLLLSLLLLVEGDMLLLTVFELVAVSVAFLYGGDGVAAVIPFCFSCFLVVFCLCALDLCCN